MTESENAVVRFVRRRLERGVPYGLGFTAAFAAVGVFLLAFLSIMDAVFDEDDIARRGLE